jgi:hypothetical protein
MALKTNDGGPSYTLWTHVENGKVMTRRIHRIEVQARNGLLYILHGDDLPDFIQTSAGHGYVGAHLAQILLSPEKLPKRTPYTAPDTKPFPTWRDIGCITVGFLAFLLVRFVLSVVTGYP